MIQNTAPNLQQNDSFLFQSKSRSVKCCGGTLRQVCMNQVPPWHERLRKSHSKQLLWVIAAEGFGSGCKTLLIFCATLKEEQLINNVNDNVLIKYYYNAAYWDIFDFCSSARNFLFSSSSWFLSFSVDQRVTKTCSCLYVTLHITLNSISIVVEAWCCRNIITSFWISRI